MSLNSLPHRVYRRYFYKLLKSYPGGHRLHFALVRLAEMSLEKVDEGDAESVFERGDWDNLIILDACRHDIYQEVTGKEVPKRTTLGSTSGQYVKRTYSEGDFSDIVYINGNGYLTDEMLEENIGRTGIFHTKYDSVLNTEDGFGKGVPPESVFRDAKSAINLFPGKRKIVHFMQPHEPFLKSDFYERIPENLRDEIANVYDIVYHGYATRSEVVQAYKDNLEYVLEFVDKLNEIMEGRTVVTADHGEYLGENHLYRHHDGSRTRILREVPWDVINE